MPVFDGTNASPVMMRSCIRRASSVDRLMWASRPTKNDLRVEEGMLLP